MNLEISLAEMKEILNEIKKKPEGIFKMMREDIKESVGEYLSSIMKIELSDFLKREPYERKEDESEPNYRNGYYNRNFTLKKIGEVSINVPRDRNGSFQTKVLPRSKRYEKELETDICLMYLTGTSTRTLSMISERLIGRRLSHTEVSNASKELIEGVELSGTNPLDGPDWNTALQLLPHHKCPDFKNPERKSGSARSKNHCSSWRAL